VHACDECGFVYASVGREDIATRLRSFAPEYARRLSLPSPALRAHPIDGVWSILEYACHVRDVLRTQRERVLVAQREDTPEFASMRREERVAEQRYNEQDPSVVAREIADAASALAALLDGLDARGWERSGVYSWPERAVRDVEWIGRHTIHECVHHLMDADRLLQIP
jgi:hypothetical protein